jgi:hypothetical protein
MRSTASVSSSGEHPKFSRTYPAPGAPNSGPWCRATFALCRSSVAGSSPQPYADVDPGEVACVRLAIHRARELLGEQTRQQRAIVREGRAQGVEPGIRCLVERRDAGESTEQTRAPLDLRVEPSDDARRPSSR